MSAGPQMFPSSPSFPPGPAEGFAGVDPLSSSLSEMDTLRMFVSERLTAAVDDILGVFGKTVARYREQIDHQRRQLDSLVAGEGRWSRAADCLQSSSWIKSCPEHQVLNVQLLQTSNTDGTDAGTSAALIKTEDGGEDCGGTEPNNHFDPSAGLEAASDDRLLDEGSDTEDSGDYWREAAELWKPNETAETEGSGKDMKSCTDLPQQHKLLPTEFNCKVCGESFQRMS